MLNEPKAGFRLGLSISAFVHILRCADGRYYVGSARGESLDHRIGEHQAGTYPGSKSRMRPVALMWSEPFDWITDAIAMERRVMGWTRANKKR